MLVGNLTAILVSAAVTVAYGLWRPDAYDWADTRALRGVEEEEQEDEEGVNVQQLSEAERTAKAVRPSC